MAEGEAGVQKRLKALRKKLAQIEKLEGKGSSLSPEEAEKVAAKAGIEDEIAELEAGGPTSTPAPEPVPAPEPAAAPEPVQEAPEADDVPAEPAYDGPQPGGPEAQKRVKALNKKLAQITKLKERGDTLTAEEAGKVASEDSILAEIAVLEGKAPPASAKQAFAPKARTPAVAPAASKAKPEKSAAVEKEAPAVAETPEADGPPADAVKQSDGSFILQCEDGSTLRWTKRPNGTWRKPEHKRAGWVGDLEQEKYMAPGVKRAAGAAGHIPGMAPVVEAKATAKAAAKVAKAPVAQPVPAVVETPEDGGPSGLERCAVLIKRLLLEPEAEKRAKALQKKLRDIEKLKEKRAAEGKLEKLQEEKVAGEANILKELGELEAAFPPRQNRAQYVEEDDDEDEAEPEKDTKKKKAPVEKDDGDSDEDDAKEKKSKNPGKDSSALKTKRQQAATTTTKSKGEYVLEDAAAATWPEVKDVAASGAGGVDRGRQKNALIVNQSKGGPPYDKWDAYIWKLSHLSRLELKLPPGALAHEDFQMGFPGGLVDLLELILKENALPTLPEKLGRLTRLRYLDVSLNAIEELPGEETWERFAGCLETLDISFNKISSVVQLKPLSKLSSLKLDKNQLTSLDGVSWGSLKQLTSISAVGNKITEIPDEIAEAGETLEWVDFSDNAIVAVPEAFCDLKKLKSFGMAGNPIKDQKVVKYLEKEGKGLKELKVYLQKPKPGKKK